MKKRCLSLFALLLVANFLIFIGALFALPNVALAGLDNCTPDIDAPSSFVRSTRLIWNSAETEKLQFILRRQTGEGNALFIFVQPAYCLKNPVTGQVIDVWRSQDICPNGEGCDKYNDPNAW